MDLSPHASPLLRCCLHADRAAPTMRPKDVKGLYLMSDYPAVTVRPGETSTVNLRLQNYDMAPERLALSVSGVPAGWTATLMGGGQPVAAAMPATNSSVALSIAARRAEGRRRTARRRSPSLRKARRSNLQLPIAVTLAKDLPAKLTLTPQLPRIARHLEVELRVSTRHQERQRQETDGQPVRSGAGKFRRHVHRAIRHARSSTRCRSMPARPRT